MGWKLIKILFQCTSKSFVKCFL